MLAAFLGLGRFWYLTFADYPLREIGVLLVIWACPGLVVPAIIVMSSGSFALGTLLPRLTMIVKVMIMAVWFFGALVLFILLRDASYAASFNLPSWYINGDPSGAGIALGCYDGLQQSG